MMRHSHVAGALLKDRRRYQKATSVNVVDPATRNNIWSGLAVSTHASVTNEGVLNTMYQDRSTRRHSDAGHVSPVVGMYACAIQVLDEITSDKDCLLSPARLCTAYVSDTCHQGSRVVSGFDCLGRRGTRGPVLDMAGGGPAPPCSSGFGLVWSHLGCHCRAG